MLPASPYARYGIAIFAVVLLLHVVGQLTSPAYSHHTSLEQARVRLGLKKAGSDGEVWSNGHRVRPWEKVPERRPELDEDYAMTNRTQPERFSATFVMLARCVLGTG